LAYDQLVHQAHVDCLQNEVVNLQAICEFPADKYDLEAKNKAETVLCLHKVPLEQEKCGQLFELSRASSSELNCREWCSFLHNTAPFYLHPRTAISQAYFWPAAYLATFKVVCAGLKLAIASVALLSKQLHLHIGISTGTTDICEHSDRGKGSEKGSSVVYVGR
jgi:hypothetical protein